MKLRSFILQILHLFKRVIPSGLLSVVLVTIYIVAGVALDEVTAVFATADDITAWYPPAALHFVLLLKFGLRYIPELLFIPLLDGLVFTPLHVAPIYVFTCALYVMLGYGTGCALLVQKLHIDPCLRRFRDVVWFTIVALVSSLLVAVSYVTTLVEAGNISWSRWGVRVLHMWAGDATGIAMLAPPLLLLLRALPWAGVNPRKFLIEISNFWRRRGKVVELIAEIVALIAISWGAYSFPSITNLNYTYFIFLPIIWIAMRHGFQRTVVAVLLLNVSVAIYVGSQFGKTSQLALQFGLMTVS